MIFPFNLLQRKATAPIPVNAGHGFGGRSFTGVNVTENNIMGLTAHYACVRLIASTLASLPVHVYERTTVGKKKRNDHPVARLLKEQPNSDMTAFSFIETMQAQISNMGKAYAEIVFDRKGNIIELWPVPAGVITPKRNKNDQIEYHVLNTKEILPAYKILHVPGLGFDGINSFSPVQLFRQTFGTGMAVEEFGARFFGQGTHIGGFLTHPQSLKDEAFQRLKSSMQEHYEGLKGSHRLILLEEGMTYNSLRMPLEDVQFIQTRKFTATEIARIHGVPPHLIGDLEKATFSNIEEQGIEAVTYLFRAWVNRWEQALNIKLFPDENERDKLYIKFDLDGLLRGNSRAQAQTFVLYLNNGVYNVDEVRDKLDMNPLPDGQGQTYRYPLHTGNAGKEESKELNDD